MTTRPARASGAAAARLEVIGELASLINTTFDLDEIFREAILKLRRVMEFRRASVVLVSEDRTRYYLHTLYDTARGGFVRKEQSFPVTLGLTGEAIRTGNAIRADDFAGSADIRAEPESRVSALIIPLRIDGTVIGTLNLGARESEKYDDTDLELAALLGRQIETSLHYSKLLATIAQQRDALAAQHAQVQSERSRLEALIEASDAAILMIRGGRVAHANQAMGDLLGRPRELLVAAPIDQVNQVLARAMTDPEALQPQLQALKGGGQPLRDRVEFKLPRRAVCQRTVAPVLDAQGGVLGHVVIYRDITREAEAETAKAEFVSVVSHELRTPLTSVKASLALMMKGAGGSITGEMQEFLSIALRNLQRLIRLVDDLLDLSRIQSGRLVTTLGPVSVEEAVARGIDAVRGFAEDRKIKLVCQETGLVPATVVADTDRLEQVIVNLLSNAIKFSPPQGRVGLRWWNESTSSVLEISDEGPGIPADQVDAIFEKFRQLERASTRKHGGAGLGLAISWGIVAQFGGDLWVESEEGSGSRFFVRLPLAEVPKS